MGSKVVFLSFADTRMGQALFRIKEEAENSLFFDEVYTCSELDFESWYVEKYGSFIRANPRGYGYWIWKSYLINRQITKMQDGDFLVYCDAGCCINKYGSKRFREYLRLASQSKTGIVGFSCGTKEGDYCKGDVLDHFDCRNNQGILNSKQVMDGILIIRICEQSRHFVQKWNDEVHGNLNLISDEPSVRPNLPSFVENRHDQSFFSLLFKLDGGCVPVSGGEVDVWPVNPQNWRRLRFQPFLAMRNRQGKDYSSIFAPYSLYGLWLEFVVISEKIMKKVSQFVGKV